MKTDSFCTDHDNHNCMLGDVQGLNVQLQKGHYISSFWNTAQRSCHKSHYREQYNIKQIKGNAGNRKQYCFTLPTNK